VLQLRQHGRAAMIAGITPRLPHRPWFERVHTTRLFIAIASQTDWSPGSPVAP
jgi:hypothetical protein